MLEVREESSAVCYHQASSQAQQGQKQHSRVSSGLGVSERMKLK